MSEKIGETNSLCPECLKTIPAIKVAENDKIYLDKECPEHGKFQHLIWTRGGGLQGPEPLRLRFSPSPAKVAVQDKDRLPRDLRPLPGPQAAHLPGRPGGHQLLQPEVPDLLRLAPTSATSSIPPWRRSSGMYQTMLDYVNHPICIQISGGRADHPGRSAGDRPPGQEMGIDYIEVNTNGVRFAEDIEFLKDGQGGRRRLALLLVRRADLRHLHEDLRQGPAGSPS